MVRAIKDPMKLCWAQAPRILAFVLANESANVNNFLAGNARYIPRAQLSVRPRRQLSDLMEMPPHNMDVCTDLDD